MKGDDTKTSRFGMTHYHTAFLCCLCCINRVWLEEEEEDYIMHCFCPCSFAVLNHRNCFQNSKDSETTKDFLQGCWVNAGFKNWFLVNGQTTPKESLPEYMGSIHCWVQVIMDARSQRSVLGEKREVFTQTTRKWKACSVPEMNGKDMR